MGKLALALVLGSVAGLIDITPMLLRRMDWHSIASAFVQWVILGVFITYIDIGINGWLKGLIIAEVSVIPIILLVAKTEPESIIPILITTAVLGSAVGFISTKYITL